MLITLMLAFALIAIGLLAVLPEIGQQIKRDREEEMRHRGTSYMRAIQHFYKKFGRYPSRIEELENTNNFRFLRKRYKDPISHDPQTGAERDFKFLHVTDVNLNNGPVLGQIPGQNAFQGQGGLQGQGALGGKQGQAALGALQGLAAQMGGVQAGIAGAQNSPNINSNDASGSDAQGNPTAAGASPNGSSENGNSGTPSSSGFNGPAFGGGPILGVASTSKDKSIRVFFDKNHYKDWLFIYVPMADRGGLLTGPVQPGLPSGNLNGVSGNAGAVAGQGQGFGQNQGFGQSQGQGFGQGQGLSNGQSQGLSNQQNNGQQNPQQ
jgi:type II secretory pathway pseudopilin PulG